MLKFLRVNEESDVGECCQQDCGELDGLSSFSFTLPQKLQKNLGQSRVLQRIANA